jgi:hypothetical protein
MKTRTIQNEYLKVEFTTDALRIMGLTLAGKPNLFIDLSDMSPVPTPYGDFHFRGGHRLWHAPEAMPRTYIPDPEITIMELPDGVFLEAPAEPGTGIRKQIRIQLAPNKPSLTLTHILSNDGLWPVELAPWAITQFRLGGTAILPMPVGNADPAGLLHNRQFSIWPYTRFNDPRVKWDDEFVLFKAEPLTPPFKIGYFNRDGWMAYWLDGVLFRKTFAVRLDLQHPDNNCNAESYCNDKFIELETLGPLIHVAPGESIDHNETWDLFDGMNSLPEDIQGALSIHG